MKNRQEDWNVFDDEIVLTNDRGYKWYLVRWYRWPDSNYTWLRTEKVQKFDLDLFDEYYLPHSSKVHISKLETIDIKKKKACILL